MLYYNFLHFFCLDLHCIPKHGKSGRTRVHCSQGYKSGKEYCERKFLCRGSGPMQHGVHEVSHFCRNTKLTILEVVNYSKQADNMLRVSSPNSVSTFSNSQYYQQLCKMCTRLVCLLAAICKSGKPATLKKKSLERTWQMRRGAKTKKKSCLLKSRATCRPTTTTIPLFAQYLITYMKEKNIYIYLFICT